MKKNGFTFLEIIFVIVAISVFVAVLSPKVFDYVEEARNSKVKLDLDRIVLVFTNFQWDTKLLPHSNGVLENDQSLDIMFLGKPGDLPQDNQWGDWKIEAIKKETNFLRRDLFLNHFMYNDPNDNGIYGDKGDYKFASISTENGWKGPYFDSPEVKQDPWGRAYMISFFTTHDGRLMCKAVSAGPNKKLEIKPFAWVDEEEILKNSDDYIKYFQKF